jgi:hypothetical protein
MNDLSDLEIDEVSFVKKGANQGARIVLWKSDAVGSQGQTGWAAGGAESYDQRYGVSKAAVPQPLSKTAMELLLADPAIYDDMVARGLLP